MEPRLLGQASPACHVSAEGKCARWRTDVLRSESARLVSACRRIRAQDFARHQAGGLTRGAAGQIRSGGQPQDRKGTRLDDARILLAARRRGNRIEAMFMAHRVNAYEAAAANTFRDSTSMRWALVRR